MDKTSILKLMYHQQETPLSSSHSQYHSLPMEDVIQVDRKARTLVEELEKDQLVEYQDSKLVLTNMGKYMAKILK